MHQLHLLQSILHCTAKQPDHSAGNDYSVLHIKALFNVCKPPPSSCLVVYRNSDSDSRVFASHAWTTQLTRHT